MFVHRFESDATYTCTDIGRISEESARGCLLAALRVADQLDITPACNCLPCAHASYVHGAFPVAWIGAELLIQQDGSDVDAEGERGDAQFPAGGVAAAARAI